MRFPRLAVLLPLLALAACGFQLRGDVALPPVMQQTFIVYEGADASLVRTAARALILSGAGVARDAAAATAFLRLTGSTVQSRVLARDPQGQPREYELAAILVFSVSNADGKVIVPTQRVTQYGNVVLDPNEPLANAGEVERAVESLREDALWEMMRRIAADAASPVNAGDDAEQP